MRFAALIAALLLLLPIPLAAQQDQAFKTYFFGNSLVQHPSDTPETSVPHWLFEIAKADGRDFEASGNWGFLRNFSANLPPAPQWSFQSLPQAWDPEQRDFGSAGMDAVVLNGANFIQYQPPTAKYEGSNPRGESPLTATLKVFDWVSQVSPKTPLFLYEGWADMGSVVRSFPPDQAGLQRYFEINKGAYHDWHKTYLANIKDARPNLDVTLIPVATGLAGLMADTKLTGLTARDLFTDDAPHGTPTLYFLAALVTYGPLFKEDLPTKIELPKSIHPLVRDNYTELAAYLETRRTGSLRPHSAPDRSIKPPTVPALAMGLNGVTDWSTQYPFIDVMKTARPWIGHLPGQWGGWDADRLEQVGYLDENGWPTRLPAEVQALESFILADLPEDADSFAGRYRLTYEGQGDLELIGRATDIDQKPGEIWFSFTPGEGLVALSLKKTDPLDPLRNIQVVQEKHLPFHELGEVFNPEWLAVIEDLRALRFMDWMFTNGSPIESWQDRPKVADYTYVRRGVPVELMIDLANTVGADPWVNMPHKADDDYIRSFALMMKNGLNPDLKAYVEYSNEVWNFTFPQTRWVQQQAAELWQTKQQDAWMQYAGMRAAQTADIWSEVYGAEADKRLVRVVGTHTGWPGLEEVMLNAPLWVKQTGGEPPVTRFDAYAVTGYFGYEMGGDDVAPQILKWLRVGQNEATKQAYKLLKAGSVKELTDELFPYHAGVAQKYGLDLIMYEGGTHVVGHGAWANDENLTRFYRHFNYTQEMAALYSDVLDGWVAAGGTFFNAFVDVAKSSQWGSWGAKRHLTDSNPRWDMLMQYNSEVDVTWDPRPASVFANGRHLGGGDEIDLIEGSKQRDVLSGGKGDDWLISNGGPDVMHGGAGTDTVELPGVPGDYRFSWMGDFLMADGPDGEVRMLSVERLEFDAAPGQVFAVTPQE